MSSEDINGCDICVGCDKVKKPEECGYHCFKYRELKNKKNENKTCSIKIQN